jgi:3-hydroxyacyl-[acyl-carrier-protein] dehydratase
MNCKQELESLPHGPEFRFLHEIVALTPGKCGEAGYHISGEEEFLKGHFPGHPIMPGVLLIEAIAQLGGVVAQSDPAHEKLSDLRLTSVKNAKILGTAGPGETLTINAQVEGRMGSLIQLSGTVSAPAGKIASATVMLSGTESPE